MKVAININPLRSGHKDRGIGFYTSNLIENLKKYPEIELQEFINLSEIKEVDVIHYPWFDFFFHTLPIKKRFKTVVTIHDVIPLLFKKAQPVGLKGKYNFLLQRLALKKCEYIITDSKVSKNDIHKILKINQNKISVVHLAANEKFRQQSDTDLIRVKRKYNLPEKFLLYVGDANWVKNLPFLISAFNQIRKNEETANIKLVLIGGVFLKKVENIDHPELEDLKLLNRLIKELNLEDKVVRPGDIDIDELVSFYNLATVYIQPSRYEGFGLPIIEAFSCGTPVVSANTGSLPEVGGNAAIYFDPTKQDQLVSLIIEILENKSLQQKLSKLALIRADQFSWHKVAEETKEVYSKLIRNEII